MTYKLGTRSLQNLSGVHPDLVSVVKKAILITEQDFTVIEGIRNIERQKKLFKSGKSTTMNSRHLTGHAVDIIPYPLVDWEMDKFYPIEDSMKKAAQDLKIDLEWGGDWKTFKDGPHWQLSWGSYPK